MMMMEQLEMRKQQGKKKKKKKTFLLERRMTPSVSWKPSVAGVSGRGLAGISLSRSDSESELLSPSPPREDSLIAPRL